MSDNHIRATCEEEKAWCGAPLSSAFYFKDAEHAAINGRTGGALVPCLPCVHKVIFSLLVIDENE